MSWGCAKEIAVESKWPFKNVFIYVTVHMFQEHKNMMAEQDILQ